MDNFQRKKTLRTAGEHDMLESFLDYCRTTILLKIDGVGDEDLRRPMAPSGTRLLGIVKHLAYVERWWFQEVFAGESPAYPWTDEDPDADFRIEPNESTEDIINLYKAQVIRARQIVAAANVEDRAKKSPAKIKECTLRWIMLHMIEETARHNGQADIIRELIDGVTGQ